MRHDSDNWTPNIWARVYGFPRGRGEGWSGRQNGLFAGKFRTDRDPTDGFHPWNYRHLRERRVLEFHYLLNKILHESTMKSQMVLVQAYLDSRKVCVFLQK